MHFWSIRSVVLSAKDNKIRKAGEELVGRPWLTGPQISFHAGQYCDHCSRSHEPGSDRGGIRHMLDRCPHRGSGQKDSRDTRKYPGGRDARPWAIQPRPPASKLRKTLEEIAAYDGWRSWPPGLHVSFLGGSV